ncbi:transcript variant X9 [Nothobranchius furzeri]|uniref:Transcript variant X9 n=1 Tax=Nothobranchius furzeri TaxID=105023 RepID=A0A9D2Y7G4_NOTFU|nr:LIM domain only protein 7 isoform X16 [Nothobranchius furzeri]KAF7215457.1 transcript variant X9 [Nothobranchius furzeri]
MEWREQSSVSCEEAYFEAQRWIEAVTEQKFGNNDFRSALENGIRLCELINKIKPGTIRRVNRLPTPIAGLDNLNVFLKACGKLGLKEAQLFHPGDLQDLSTRVTVKHQETNRRLKNVLITIFWLGRRAQFDRLYNGPYLNLKAFEGLLGTALYKALQESDGQKGNSIRDSGFGDSWCSEREELHHLRGGGGESGGHRRDDSLDSLDSVGSRPHSISSDTTLKGSSEGCCSDTKADSIFKMANNQNNISYRRSLVITPKASTQFNQFLPSKDKPSGYVPAPLRKKRAERSEDSRRSLSTLSYAENEGPLTRELQTQESMDGSKSTSDILEDAPVLHQNRFEELQKYREQIKRSEDRWQDDLSKWKNRRRSVNSDIVKKKEEREKIEQITYGADRGSKSFKDVQEERENKGRSSIGSRLGSLSFLGDSEEVFDAPVVSLFTRNRLPRSSTIDTPYHSSEYSRRAEEPPPASLPTLRAASPPTAQEAEAVDSPAASSPTIITPINHISVTKSSPPADAPEHKSQAKEHAIKTEEATSVVSSSSSTQEEPEPEPLLLGAQTKVEAPSSGSLQKKPPQFSSMEPKPPGVSQVSASLPRSYQISNGARLTSVVTPRPFGSQSSRIASLPRAYTVDDTSKRVNGNVDVSKKASVPSRYQQFMTSEDEALSSSAHSSEEEEEEEKTKSESSTSNPSVSSASSDVKTEAPVSSAPAKETSKKNFCDMRISLNQKPNSSRDFGFHAAWDSTGARVTSIQPGSPAEMCQLQVGDEVLMVNGHKVAEMSYTAWKSCMEEALQEGSLVMDVRRHGQNSTPETKTVSSSLDFTSLSFTETGPAKDAPTPLLVDVASNRVNGNLQEESVTMRNKESEPMSLKNLKRRSEFFEQGGSESTVPDIPVPVITPSSSRWSWDPEEERRRQEKWQKEQERLLQEKYRRDQEKLQEEWLKAQQEISTSVGQQEQPGSLQVNSHSIRPRSPPSSAHRPTPLWEEEEQKGKLEEERQRQEQERRKREEEERELQRLQEERRRKEMQEEEERMRKEEEELRWQRRREEEREEERRRQEAVEQQRRARFLEQQWSGTSHGFDSVQHPLSFTDRARSQSSPQLDEEDKPQQGGAHEQPEGATQWLQREKLRIARDRQAQSLRIVMEWEMRNESKRAVTGAGVTEKKAQLPSSQAEADRQQILNEMKKKTPLLTDGSWIRQRSASTVNSKDSDVPPMRRGESLDNLDASSNSWHSSSRTPRSSSFAQNYSRPQSALYSNTSFYTGGSGAPRPVSSTLPSSHSTGSLRGWTGTNSSPWSQPSPSLSTPPPITSPDPISEAGAPQQQSRSVSGKKICTFCDTPLGKGAAMIIESLGLCYHLGCFKCIDCKCDLGGSKAGAEVRIRNKQLYCNSCYVRFKSGQPTSI